MGISDRRVRGQLCRYPEALQFASYRILLFTREFKLSRSGPARQRFRPRASRAIKRFPGVFLRLHGANQFFAVTHDNPRELLVLHLSRTSTPVPQSAESGGVSQYHRYDADGK